MRNWILLLPLFIIAGALAHPPSLDEKKLRGFFTSGSQECEYMTLKKWDEFTHACEWDAGWQGIDLFFRRSDGSFVYECKCEDGILESYRFWIERDAWIQVESNEKQNSDDDRKLKCYVRNGKTPSAATTTAAEIAKLFDSATCAKQPDTKYQSASCDTRTKSCNALTGANLLEGRS